MTWKIFALSLILSAAAFGQNAKHPFTFEDMMKLKRLDGPQPSPDGKWVVFSATDVDLEANTKISHIWIVPATGGESKRLNETPNHEERPRFSPDGKRLIWTSKATDPTQIWMCDFDSGSGTLVGKPHQVTSISTGADGAIWSPDGKNIVFVSAVYPDCKDDACNKQRDDQRAKSKVKAKIFTRLFYRHWNAFTEFKRSHLFVISADASASGSAGGSPAASDVSSDANANVLGGTPSTAAGTTALPNQNGPRDLTPGDHDVPPFNLGGQEMYAISPDGQELAYTSNIDEVEATSTNNEIFTVPINAPSADAVESAVPSGKGKDALRTAHATVAPRKISTSPGADTTPLYSPDGKYLAWRSQARAGFEADKWRLFAQDRSSQQVSDQTPRFERSVGTFAWYQRPDASPSILFAVEDHGETPIYLINLRRVGTDWDDQGGHITEPEGWHGHADDLVCLGRTFFYSRASISSPNEVWSFSFGDESDKGWSSDHQITHMNDALMSQIDMQPLESFTFKGANDEEVQGFMVKPPGFDPNKKYPLKFLIHGGPQGAWGDSWTYRWNAELFAANGYVVVMINFHGSTGYGQKFTDSISGDWGGKPYVDLMRGLDYVEKTYPFIDKNREAALGASYGGYMANWLLGHTDRFKCIVSHDGMFNTESAWGTTEELWFPEWEFKGPPWKNRELYKKFSPDNFADKFKTPTLVVHGQNDYRLDVSEGFQLFTTLQRLKIPSKMLYFPDEGHWVLKPQNSQLWYKTVNDWVDQWCKR
jgi:dipeptidyl aminopeptidase/acylaminoacyl peptidase